MFQTVKNLFVGSNPVHRASDRYAKEIMNEFEKADEGDFTWSLMESRVFAEFPGIPRNDVTRVTNRVSRILMRNHFLRADVSVKGLNGTSRLVYSFVVKKK